MMIIVRQPGMLTTRQDHGWQNMLHLSLSRGGAMDPDALATANQLVGNPLDACGLEFTGMGPTLFFPQALCLAWTGGMMPATMTVANKAKAIAVSLPSHRPVVVPAGATVRWGACLAGFRCWLAVAGGIEAPSLLASRSSHLAAVIGGTPLRKDDQLTVGSPSNHAQRIQSVIGSMTDKLSWSVSTTVPALWPVIEIAALPGRHFSRLSEEDQKRLLEQIWTVSSSSNRQGLSLSGERLSTTLPNILSEPVREGTVQLPPSGQPIVLLAEHQSTGGYPRVLEILSKERARLAQAGPSARILFRLVSLEQADRLRASRQRAQDALRDSIAGKLSSLCGPLI